MSTSSVTMSGSSAWICFSASYPFRAVPATANSPESVMICDVRRRMKALSSTTSTRSLLEDTRSLFQRPNLDASIVEKQVDAASVISADIFGNDRDLCLGQHAPNGGDVSLADVDAARGN